MIYKMIYIEHIKELKLEGKIEMEKFEINDFSKTIAKENMVHPEDINTIVDVFVEENKVQLKFVLIFFSLVIHGAGINAAVR